MQPYANTTLTCICMSRKVRSAKSCVIQFTFRTFRKQSCFSRSYTSMMNIIIKTITHDTQNYDTTGDWDIKENGDIEIRVSNVDHWKTQYLVALHEMIEVALCKDRGISQEEVEEFDRGHPELEDPGSDPQAPYYKEHSTAVEIEQRMARELGVDWDEHCDRLYKMWTPPSAK